MLWEQDNMLCDRNFLWEQDIILSEQDKRKF
jgi:hypothetical protein